MNQRKKPSYTDEFKAEAVVLVSQQGGHIPEVARNLGISESALRCWVAKEQKSGLPATSLGPLEKELRELKQKLHQTEQERDILKNCQSAGLLRQPIEMRFKLMKEQANLYSVSLLCKVLQVSRSGYYAWRHRGISQRKQTNLFLLSEIKVIHQQSRQTYGVRHAQAALQGKGLRYNTSVLRM